MVDYLHRISLRRWRLALRALVAGVIVAGSGAASAGFVTTFEAGMDSIFSQLSFGTRKIDIQFNPTVTVAAASLLSIGEGEFDDLTPLRGSLAANIVSVFYVDAITFCGGGGGNIIGCGNRPGNVIALKSSSASSNTIGAKLMAHELGHNLGLEHVTVGSNLMNGTIGDSSSELINDDQVTNIFATNALPSPELVNKIIQGNATDGYFISITPYAVVAVVPEPHTWAMMGLGLLGIMTWVRRRPQPVAWRTT